MGLQAAVAAVVRGLDDAELAAIVRELDDDHLVALLQDALGGTERRPSVEESPPTVRSRAPAAGEAKRASRSGGDESLLAAITKAGRAGVRSQDLQDALGLTKNQLSWELKKLKRAKAVKVVGMRNAARWVAA